METIIDWVVMEDNTKHKIIKKPKANKTPKTKSKDSKSKKNKKPDKPNNEKPKNPWYAFFGLWSEPKPVKTPLFESALPLKEFQNMILGEKIYILELEDNNWYIGWTNSAGKRIANHFNGKGADWTKKHKPIRIVQIVDNGTLEMENKITIQYMLRYGYENVRGGGWCRNSINKPKLLNKTELCTHI